MSCEHFYENHLPAIRVTQYDIVIDVIPQLGGKISSILWNSRQVLAKNPRKPFQLARYASSYADYDASGFDECFPTIGQCVYPELPLIGIEAPDHGELWSIPWREEHHADGLCLAVGGRRFPYRFKRWLTIPEPGRLHLRYELTNLAEFSFKYIWSAHPLLALKPKMRIVLPRGVRVIVDWSKDGRLGECFDRLDWPRTKDAYGHKVDLSKIYPATTGTVEKLYTTRLHQGFCALFDPSDGFYVGMSFSPQQIPFVGLSINLGGWPVDEPGYYNLGLEPCNGYPDRLDLAMMRGVCQVSEPHSITGWEWDLFIGQADNLDTVLNRICPITAFE
jgi:hypothetical protein